jgi:hypothetical protein
MNNWEAVDKEIVNCLTKSGLLKEAGVFVRNEVNDLKLYEFPTLQLLEAFALHNPEYKILYLHTKGVSFPNFKPVDDWRACMLYFNVERWKEMVKKLDTHDTCGVNYIADPIPHYQGNFWWSNASHINRLGAINDVQFKTVTFEGIKMFDRHKCEFWLLSQKCKPFSPYHHHINPYIIANPRNNYECVAF